MQIEKIQFEDIRYNPEISAFETLIRIHDGAQGYSYPVHVTAPLHADYGIVTRGLAEAGRRAHRHGKPALRLTHAAQPAHAKAPTPPAAQTDGSLLDRLLGKRAA